MNAPPALKVLYVVPPSMHFAGIERVVHDIACGLATQYPQCFEVTVFYCHRYAELQGELPYRVVWDPVRKLRQLPFRVGRVLRADRYDVAVVAQFEPAALTWLWHRLGGGRTRFVMHLHGNPKTESASSRRARLAFGFFDAVLPRMKVVAVSAGLARHVGDRLGRPGWVEVMPNPVRQFAAAERAAGREGPVAFVSVGRLSPEKGQDVLVQAFSRVRAQGLDARLTLVGDGPERAALEAQVRALGLSDCVRMAGRLADPAEELAGADCFVSASRSEGFGVAIVEAMSAGLPVIASDCEFGPADLVDEPGKGVLVPVGDVDALAAAMAQFVRDGRRADAPAQVALRREAAARFSLEQVIPRHAAMLDAVAGRGQAAWTDASGTAQRRALPAGGGSSQ